MTRLGLGSTAAVLTFMAMLSVGCCDKQNQELATLKNQNAGLISKNGTLMEQLAKLQQDKDAMTSQLDAKDGEIAMLKSKGVTGTLPPGGAVATNSGGGKGWEHGLVGDRLTLASDILFGSGKADLTDAGKGHLDKLVADLKGAYANMPIRIYGYTDNEPIKKTKDLWDDNLELSANRAMTVTRYIVAKGIRADRIETVAMGETHPSVANSSTANKSKNRRVEVIVIKNAAAAGKASAAPTE